MLSKILVPTAHIPYYTALIGMILFARFFEDSGMLLYGKGTEQNTGLLQKTY